MTFISYAPNAEDVPLWRALGSVTAGRYLDWGREPADGPSVTRAFYDRGWRGISVRPAGLVAALAAARPLDTVAADGAPLPLSGTLHFLRLEAEGDEAAILRRLDLDALRPCVLVLPAWNERADQIAQDSQYRPVLFDGVSRFYLGPGQEELLADLSAPANVRDNYLRAVDCSAADRLAAAEAALEVADARVQGSSQRLVDAVKVAGVTRDDMGRMTEEFVWLRGLNTDARRAEGESHAEAAWLRGQLHAAREANEEHLKRLLARAEETAWLRGCVADAESRVTSAQAKLAEAGAHLASETGARRDAEARAHDCGLMVAAMQTSTSWRVTAPLRRLRRKAPAPAPSSPVIAPPDAPAPIVEADVAAVPFLVERLLEPTPTTQNLGWISADAGQEFAAASQRCLLAPPGAGLGAPKRNDRVGPEHRSAENTGRMTTAVEYLPSLATSSTAVQPEPDANGAIAYPRYPLAAPPALLPDPPGLVATVHQFHAGSASGDAITNAMLLIRAQLRAAGFRSDIYVEHRGPGLGQDIKLLDSIPRHDGYVLLFHHSMGFPGFSEIMALPARKVLVYHNITPPEMLAGIPRIQRLGEIGREQLAALPGQVAFALADSDFNAMELTRLGFSPVRTCPLLFDIDALTRRATGVRPGDGVFTVLFVGRVTPSKSQDALVDAFAAFRERFGRPCRLVLAGALDADEHAFITTIQQHITAAGLEGSVHLTGLVSDRELHDWYRQADLYVSLSRHEGFGVPLVEALAHGVPVVAWPTGAVPFTLGGAGKLLASRDPADVAAAMLEAVAERPTLSARGLRSLGRWALDRHVPMLMQALAAAGAVPPRDAAARQAIAANLQVTICGHMAKTYSLAAVNRGVARTIEGLRPGTVRIVPVEGEVTADLDEVPGADRGFVAGLASRVKPETGPELVLSGHYPLHIPAHRGDLLAALFFWEESLVPAATVATLNQAFDAVFAPSQSVAKALVDSGVSVPVLNLGQAPDLSRYARPVPDKLQATPPPDPFPQGEEERARFTFLHVSSAFPRKGLDVLLAAWARAFTYDDPVRLIVKVFPNPHNDAAAQIAQIREDWTTAAPIELIDEDLSPVAMVTLYRNTDTMVLPSRGEGYNLPAAEAMAAGLPVIVTGHGGHMDFCTPDTARLIKRRLAPSGSHLAPPHSLWAEPDVSDLVAALREAASGALAGLTEPAQQAIAALTDAAAFTTRLTNAAARLLLTPPAPKLRLTWVSSWGVRCGIAEYSRALLGALPREGLAEFVILADDRTVPEKEVHTAWRLGDAASVDRLYAAIAKADGDVTVIQHQPMLLAWPSLARLLDCLADDGRVTVVTLHNTLHLLEVAEAERFAAVRALGRTARVLVHTLADVERLDALGLSSVTTLLPQGTATPAGATVRALPEDAAPVIGSTGFFLPDKGLPALITATSRLRARWPAIRLRLVNAEYDHPDSAAEIAACRELAVAERLTVEWHTEFMPLHEQHKLLHGCDLIVLPYQRSKEASSAALRSALASGSPVAVTPLPIFDEAAGAVFRLPGTGAAAIELGIASLLGNAERRTTLAASARDWMADRALPDIARRLHGMLLGLAAQARSDQPTDGSLWR